MNSLIIDYIVYYLNFTNVKNLSLTDKTIRDVLKPYINTHQTFINDKQSYVKLYTLKWFKQYYKIDDNIIYCLNAIQLLNSQLHQTIIFNTYFMNNLITNNRLDIIIWWKNSDIEFVYDNMTIDIMTYCGHIHMLEWWLSTNLPIEYSYRGIDYASSNGYTHMLRWWKEVDLEFKYTTFSMNMASYNGYTNTLDWWIQSGYELKYTNFAIDEAIKVNDKKILKWWKISNLPIDYFNLALNPPKNILQLLKVKELPLYLKIKYITI